MGTSQRRTIATAAVVATGVFLALAGAKAVADSSSGERSASAAGAGAPPAEKPGATSFRRVQPAPVAQASRCKLRCVKRNLKRLVRKHNKLVSTFNALATDYYQCQGTVNVTRYGGYDYNGSIGAATALDFTDPGDPVDRRAVVYTC